nr:cobyric acid synthase [Fusobacterium russii]
MKKKNIMIMGTSSGAGKSTFAAALCRIFYKDGLKVVPFKSQNMALNSFFTKDGKEMGVGQAIQAEAAGVEASVKMNPILLKPTKDKKIQIYINGEKKLVMTGVEYNNYKKNLISILEENYKELKEKNDIIVIEGAGSPAEINIKQEDISNFGMARVADAPVILVADIDRGGVFASIYGTIMLLSEEDRKRIKGIVINKFRGNAEVLKTGFEIIEKLTGVPTLGVLPYEYIDLEDEDSISEKDKNPKLRDYKILDDVYRLEQFDKLEKLVRENIDIEKIYEIVNSK